MTEPMFRHARTARDVMRPVGIMMRESDDVWEAAKRLFESGQTGAPVLDAEGKLVGIVSQSDVASYLRESTRRAPDFYAEPDRDPIPASNGARVGQRMSRVLVQVPEDMSLDEIERHMLRRRVQRVLVVADGKVLGVVAATDILGAR